MLASDLFTWFWGHRTNNTDNMTELIEVQILYFAVLKDRTGQNSETLSVKKESTLASIYRQLQKKYDLPEQHRLKVAINDSFSSWDHRPSHGDTIVFIPPVTGG